MTSYVGPWYPIFIVISDYLQISASENMPFAYIQHTFVIWRDSRSLEKGGGGGGFHFLSNFYDCVFLGFFLDWNLLPTFLLNSSLMS
jgi:hypothetical protein